MKEQKSLFASVREWDAVKAEKDAAFVRISFDWDDPAVDSIVREAAANGMRLELALRTAPGYQPDQAESKAPRLFQAAEAREPFLAFWENIAKKYAAEGDWLSFALLERPYGYWRELPDLGNAEYASVMRRAVARIRAISPSRPITLDGLDRGLNPLTDLFDLDVTQAFWPIDGKETLRMDIWATYRHASGQRVCCYVDAHNADAALMVAQAQERQLPCVTSLRSL